MAINSSITNLCSSFLPNISGILINNKFINVTKSNLNNLEYLIYLEFLGIFITVILALLIPKK